MIKSTKIYPRRILPQIEKALKAPEIIVIHGARQTGKTTLMRILMDKLKKTHKPANVVYFDLEDFELLELCNFGVKSVVEHLKAIGCDFDKRIFLFIDEIQYLSNPSSFLKLFFDQYGGKIKLIISGSSSFAIKSKFKDSLVGRTIDFELFGLDFEEFLSFKNISYDLKTADWLAIKKLKELFQEFVFYGAYPRVVLENSLALKEKLIKQIINTYLKKDIRDLANIADINKFNKLLRILAQQSGSLLNVLEMANTLGVARPTLDNYLMILENTYVIKLITPFSGNIRSELTKMPKIYFEDTGIKNILETGAFPKVLTGKDLETAVFNLLRKKHTAEELHFWRTVQKDEIDFVVEKPNKFLVYEVKLNSRNKDRLAFGKFKKNYKKALCSLVGFDFIDKVRQKGLNFLYPWQL